MKLSKKLTTLAIVGAMSATAAVASAANIGLVNMSQVVNSYPGYGALDMKMQQVDAQYRPQIEKKVQEIEKISSEADKTFKKLDSVAESLNNKMKIANESLSRIYGNIKSINLYDLERLIGLLDKYNSMSEKEKELMKILLST